MTKVRDCIIIGGIFLAALAIGVWAQLRMHQRLDDLPLANATRVMAFTLPPDTPANWAYDWLDAKTVLVHTMTGDYAVDVATGKRSTPAGIGKVVAKYGGKPISTGMFGWVLSPDRQFAVAAVAPKTRITDDDDVATTVGHWMFVKLDGSITLDLGPASEMLDRPVWRPDNKGWLEFYSRSSTETTVSAWAIDRGIPVRQSRQTAPTFMSALRILGAPSNTDVLTMDDSGESSDNQAGTYPYKSVRFSETDSSTITTCASPGTTTSGPPEDYALSPDRASIAWVLTFMPRETTPAIDGQALSGDLSGAGLDEIVITSAAGSGARVVAKFQGNVSDGITSLRWMPDGKRISYICDGALWSIPVD